MAVAVVLTMVAAAAEAQPLGYAIAGPSGYTGFFDSPGVWSIHAAGGGELLAG